MTRRVRSLSTCVLACAAALSVPAVAKADPWEVAVSVYVWGSGIDAAVGTPFGTVDTNLSFGDILENLDFAFYGGIEARNGPWVILGDLNYSDLSASRGTPFGLLFSDAEVSTQLTILTLFGGHAVVDRSDLRLEAGGGLRYYDLNAETRLVSAGAVPDATFGRSDSWADLILGLHLRAPLSDRWVARGFADVGGFGLGEGSDLSWQIYAGAGYALNDRWLLEFGYRHLSIEQDLDGAAIDLQQSGPLIGVTARF